MGSVGIDDISSTLFWNGSPLSLHGRCGGRSLTAPGYDMLHQEPFGRSVYRDRANPIAARFSSISVGWTKIVPLFISGITRGYVAGLTDAGLAARMKA